MRVTISSCSCKSFHGANCKSDVSGRPQARLMLLELMSTGFSFPCNAGCARETAHCMHVSLIVQKTHELASVTLAHAAERLTCAAY